jgi:hypothetical membrane protein
MRTKELARWGAFAGVLAPVLFTTGFTVAGLLKPDHSPVRDVISDLGAGPYAWIQNTNFSVTGVCCSSHLPSLFGSVCGRC